MNYRTQDVIVWDGFPHPDPRSRHAEASVRIAPSFWSRLAQHVRDAPLRAARALWEDWLTAEGVNALASRTAADIDDAFAARGPRTAATAGVRRETAGDLPPVAVERLRATIASSLEAPLAMCFHTGSFHTGATSSSRPALYCLVLTNGAHPHPPRRPQHPGTRRLLFQPRRDRGVARCGPGCLVPGDRRPSARSEFADVTAAAALLAMGGGAFQLLRSGTAAPALPVNADRRDDERPRGRRRGDGAPLCGGGRQQTIRAAGRGCMRRDRHWLQTRQFPRTKDLGLRWQGGGFAMDGRCGLRFHETGGSRAQAIIPLVERLDPPDGFRPAQRQWKRQSN